MMSAVDPLSSTLAMRERTREMYWRRRDPIIEDRLLWRAQTFRHIMHVLPGQSILEIGCGNGAFTRQLAKVTRGECPLTAVTFDADFAEPPGLSQCVEFLPSRSLPGALDGRSFCLIIAHDMLDKRNAAWLLQHVLTLLTPGGRALFYESNPWNIIRRLRLSVRRLARRRDPRLLLSRPDLYELLSELGFVRIFALFNDFVYPPLPRSGIWFLRNFSIILENIPGVRSLAGSILLHAQKPPLLTSYPRANLVVDDRFRDAVSVVVPCHNEEMNVGPLVFRLIGLYHAYIREIILVNDNSTDDTRDVIDELTRRYPRVKSIHRVPPNGVGLAIADGLAVASGRYVLSVDCDFQHLLPEVRDLFDGIAEGYDVAVGSRFSRHSVLLNYPLVKIMANRAFHFIARAVLIASFRDLTNNLKLMRREVAQNLLLREPGFAVNAEIGLQPLLMGYRVKEVPISWIGRGVDMGVSSFRVLRAGGGYWRVLRRLWLWRLLKIGPYAALRRRSGVGPDEQGTVVATAR
jgi:dolichol-phosphate mannosyltransferase